MIEDAECLHCNAIFSVELSEEDEREISFCPVCGSKYEEPEYEDDDYDQLELDMDYEWSIYNS